VDGRRSPTGCQQHPPRVGFAYTLTDRTVLRGGAGLYYADVRRRALLGADAVEGRDHRRQTGRPAGLSPRIRSTALHRRSIRRSKRFCYVRNTPGMPHSAHRRTAAARPEYAEVPHKLQTHSGSSTSSATTTALTADYVYSHGYNENILQSNINGDL
jgi:hypothetical protein